MYQQVMPADQSFITGNGGTYIPVATFADQYGGRAQIAIDDHCYVLYLKRKNGRYAAVNHWWDEIIKAVQNMPTPTEYEKEYERFLNREW